MSTGPQDTARAEVVVVDTTIDFEPESPSAVFATLTLRIRNTGQSVLSYGACGNILQRVEDDELSTVWTAACLAIDQPRMHIAPGAEYEEEVDVGMISASVNVETWAEQVVGEYQLITNLADGKNGSPLPLKMQTSNVFQLSFGSPDGRRSPSTVGPKKP